MAKAPSKISDTARAMLTLAATSEDRLVCKLRQVEL